MARINRITALRTSRASLTSMAGSSGLLQGEPYLVTDEGRLAIGLSTTTSASLALTTDFSSAAYKSIGTSGGTVPLLNTANTWGAAQTFNSSAAVGTNLTVGGAFSSASAYLSGSMTFANTPLGIGFGVANGWYGDASNMAIRVMNSSASTLYIQSYNGASNFATFNAQNIVNSVPVVNNSTSTTLGIGHFCYGADNQVSFNVNEGVGSANTGIEIGKTGRASSGIAYLDFHTSGNSPDYDFRLYAYGGSTTTGQGGLSMNGSYVTFNATTQFKIGLNHQDGDGNARFRYDSGGSTNWIAPNGGFYMSRGTDGAFVGRFDAGSWAMAGNTFYFNNNGSTYISNDGNYFTVGGAKLNLQASVWHRSQEGYDRMYWESGGSNFNKSPNGWHFFQRNDGANQMYVDSSANLTIRGNVLTMLGGGRTGTLSNSGDRWNMNGHVDANGSYMFASYFYQSSGNDENPGVTQVMVQNGDNYTRKAGIGYFTDRLATAMSGRNGNIWQFTQNSYNVNDGQQASLVAYNGDPGQGKGAYMSFHRGGAFAINMGLDGDNVFRWGGWSAAANRLQLDMGGNLTAAGDVTAYSDIRLKTNIRTIPNALATVRLMRGVMYDRIDQDMRASSGVIAQEFELIAPELVQTDTSGTKSVNYGNTLGYTVEAIKEVADRADRRDAMIAMLLARITSLETVH